ncbi:hypothetical protein AB6V29_02570 [Microbacterium sp. 20-116]|uniref:hypothetical protein n=1 Tax=Microbacterium sp. 20-116 TaxID=3239883 RepID=UPI0034E1EBFD
MSPRPNDRSTLERRRTSDAEPDPRNHEQPPPALVRERLRGSSVLVPGAITVPCPDHGADVGEPCTRTARGVCAERIKRRAATR